MAPRIAILVALAAICIVQVLGTSQIGFHSMLFLNTPFGGKEAFFREAKAVGASVIRFDIALEAVFVDKNKPDWSGVDEFVTLARRYKIRCLADILGTPWWLTVCPSSATGNPGTCPPSDPHIFADLAGQVAARTRGVINDFEIINEADGSWAFVGTPQQYAAIFSASADAIHRANPKAKVSLAGLMLPSKTWISKVFATPGLNVAKKFDIANVHLRSAAAENAVLVKMWRKFFSKKCAKCPLWVTESGYPSDPALQTEKKYQGGESAQARWMHDSFTGMFLAGANMVFATSRDYGTGNRYASEGILHSTDPVTNSPVLSPKRSFHTVKALAKKFHGQKLVQSSKSKGKKHH